MTILAFGFGFIAGACTLFVVALCVSAKDPKDLR
jgi:hypothetical protein